MFNMLKTNRGGISSILEVTIMLIFLVVPWVWFGIITGWWFWLWFWVTMGVALGVWELIAKWKTGKTLSQQFQAMTKEDPNARLKMLIITVLVNIGWLTLWYHLWAKYLKQVFIGD